VAILAVACGGGPTPVRLPANEPAFAVAAKPSFSSVDPAAGTQEQPPPGMAVLASEIERSMSALRLRGEFAPYFIGQQLIDYDSAEMSASNGALTSLTRGRMRALMTDVRVGGHDLDSTHPIDGESENGSFTIAPLDVLADAALQRISWREIDQAYKSASARFAIVKSRGNVRVGLEDRSGDFSRERPVTHIGSPAEAPNFSEGAWLRRIRALSARLRDHPHVHGAGASFEALSTTRWTVNSEGTRIQVGETLYRVNISGHTRADDGMELSRSEQFMSKSASGLPDDATLAATVDVLARQLSALRSAKTAEPFVGPAILAGRAAGVFFHETFGHRVEGERQKLDDEGQTFARKLGERVMPTFLNVYDDPRLTKLGSIELGGSYRFDDDGVPAQRATLVESGILKGFLMSRVPARGIVRSNGHGRRVSGSSMARQANLVVEPSHAVTSTELRRLLVAEARRQKKPYGLLFDEIEGGYTETLRDSTQGYKLLPVIVYRVFVDGRPDELIRGVDIVGTPLISLTKVLATDDRYAVFNGSCGAESGWVSVSATSPSLLVQQIEVALRDKGNVRPPILPAPTEKAALVR
jgi:predicted Zn-dependent protease